MSAICIVDGASVTEQNVCRTQIVSSWSSGCGQGMHLKAIVLLGDSNADMSPLTLCDSPHAQGTFAGILSKHLRVPHISSGDLIRSEMAKGSKLAQTLAGFVKKGECRSLCPYQPS